MEGQARAKITARIAFAFLMLVRWGFVFFAQLAEKDGPEVTYEPYSGKYLKEELEGTDTKLAFFNDQDSLHRKIASS